MSPGRLAVLAAILGPGAALHIGHAPNIRAPRSPAVIAADFTEARVGTGQLVTLEPIEREKVVSVEAFVIEEVEGAIVTPLTMALEACVTRIADACGAVMRVPVLIANFVQARALTPWRRHCWSRVAKTRFGRFLDRERLFWSTLAYTCVEVCWSYVEDGLTALGGLQTARGRSTTDARRSPKVQDEADMLLVTPLWSYNRNGTQRYSVCIPKGCVAGDLMGIEGADGVTILTVVPAGYEPGCTMWVDEEGVCAGEIRAALQEVVAEEEEVVASEEEVVEEEEETVAVAMAEAVKAVAEEEEECEDEATIHAADAADADGAPVEDALYGEGHPADSDDEPLLHERLRLAR